MISAELAGLLSLEEMPYKETSRPRIRGFATGLKGVWGGLPYPIIQYHEDWKKWDNGVRYDWDVVGWGEDFYPVEDEDGQTGKHIGALEKILIEAGEIHRPRSILGKLPKDSPPAVAELSPVRKPTVEVHCVLVLFNESGEVLIAKRAANKTVLPNKWEFGCGQLHEGITFRECLLETYATDFGLELEPSIEMHPLGEYEFSRPGPSSRVVGMLFCAALAEKGLFEKAENLSSSHTEVKWARAAELEAIAESDCVPGFHSDVAKARRLTTFLRNGINNTENE